MGRSSFPCRLVADVGGTHARFALTDPDSGLHAPQTLLVADHPSLEAAIAHYLEAIGRPAIEAAAIAMAGPVLTEGAALTNGAWRFDTAALARHIGIDSVLVLNDFEALAWSLPNLAPTDLVQIGGDAPVASAPKVVIGPGTGFGGAVLLAEPHRQVLPSEIGHTSLPIATEGEARIAAGLADRDGHIPVENALSGPGLAALYRQCAKAAGAAPRHASAAAIVEAARGRTEPAATHAVDLFITWLGSVAGNAALLYRADGGVYIAGGIAPKMRDLLADGRLRRAFDRKGRMSALVESIPLYVVTAHAPALQGAAAHLDATLKATPEP